MKYIIIEFECTTKYGATLALPKKNKEKILVEFSRAKKIENDGLVFLKNAKIIDRKNPNTVIELKNDHEWRYIHTYKGFKDLNEEALSIGYYEKNVINDKASAKLIFDYKE